MPGRPVLDWTTVGGSLSSRRRYEPQVKTAAGWATRKSGMLPTASNGWPSLPSLYCGILKRVLAPMSFDPNPKQGSKPACCNSNTIDLFQQALERGARDAFAEIASGLDHAGEAAAAAAEPDPDAAFDPHRAGTASVEAESRLRHIAGHRIADRHEVLA